MSGRTKNKHDTYITGISQRNLSLLLLDADQVGRVSRATSAYPSLAAATGRVRKLGSACARRVGWEVSVT